MLEIPESTTIARQLNETVSGKSVVNVVAAHPRTYLLSSIKIRKIIRNFFQGWLSAKALALVQ